MATRNEEVLQMLPCWTGAYIKGQVAVLLLNWLAVIQVTMDVNPVTCDLLENSSELGLCSAKAASLYSEGRDSNPCKQ
jgi:hypothetical protein